MNVYVHVVLWLTRFTSALVQEIKNIVEQIQHMNALVRSILNIAKLYLTMNVLVISTRCPRFCAEVRSIILDYVGQERNIIDVV